MFAERKSKTHPRGKAFLIGCLFLLLAASMAIAYELDWWTIDGASGTSTGGSYSLSGTMGQPEAGTTLTGGSYTLNGGFWYLPRASATGSRGWESYR